MISLTLEDGTPIQNDKQYMVATSAYIASGGNENRQVTSLTDWEKTPHLTHTVFIEKMRLVKKLNAALQGRIIDVAKQ